MIYAQMQSARNALRQSITAGQMSAERVRCNPHETHFQYVTVSYARWLGSTAGHSFACPTSFPPPAFQDEKMKEK